MKKNTALKIIDNQDAHITLRVSETEKDQLKAEAKAMGLSFSSYTRMLFKNSELRQGLKNFKKH